MTAQASGTIGGGQGFLRNLGRTVFGPSQQEISASRTQEAFRRNQELLEQQGNAARGAVIPNAQAEAAAMQILQPVQLGQARSVQDLSIRGAETEADIQRKNDAQRAGLVQDTMRTRGDVTTGVNRPVFDHVQQLASIRESRRRGHAEVVLWVATIFRAAARPRCRAERRKPGPGA
jgi:hypothetical protein